MAIAQKSRTTLRDKLILRYVSNPNASSPSWETLNNTEIYNGTYNGAFWNSSNMAGARQLVKALISGSGNGGDARLQLLAAEIIKIRDKPTIVYLLNDKSISINNNAKSNYANCDDGNGKFWPCANSFEITSSRAGHLFLGTFFLTDRNPQNLPATEIKKERYGTFLHELTHTQDNLEWRPHLHRIGTRWYSYGQDGTHYYTEILPDINATYSEAIANAFSMYYHTSYYDETFDWFARGGEMLVEHPPSGASPAFTSWYSTLNARGITPVRNSNQRGFIYSHYNMAQIPLDILMNNENILAVTLEACRKYGGTSKYMRALTASNNELWKVSAQPVAVMFRNLCEMGLPPGVNEEDIPNVTLPAGSHVFPLALADFFSGYEAQSIDEFKSIFGNQAYMNNYIENYWTSYRASVQAAAPLQSEIGDMVENIKQALNMT